MPRRKDTPEQIVRKLREADRMLNVGVDVPAIARHLQVIETTYHRWQNQHRGKKADDAMRLRELEKQTPSSSGLWATRSSRTWLCETAGPESLSASRSVTGPTPASARRLQHLRRAQRSEGGPPLNTSDLLTAPPHLALSFSLGTPGKVEA